VDPNWPLQRPNRDGKARQLGAIRRAARKSPVSRDCVVVDAVQIEPVSAAKFPGNKEINWEFS